MLHTRMLQHIIHFCAGVTLNRNLFETVLRHLLVESAEYSVQMFEGSGSQWRKTRHAPDLACGDQPVHNP